MKCVYATEPSESRTSALKRRFGELEEKNKSLQFSYDGLHDLFDAISSRSEADAAAIFQSMRQGVPLNVVLQNLQTANLLMQLQVGPEKHFHYSFPYRTAMPEFLFQGPNPYVQSAMYDAAVMVRSPGYEPASGSRGPGSGAIPPNLHAVKFRPQYLRPYFSATLADRRLSIVEPSKWTSVSTDDNMMRRLLELYLLHEFHWMSCFQKDIFLDDMVSGSTNFCSSLLVNAILAQACVSPT
jgi:hypothetical protein